MTSPMSFFLGKEIRYSSRLGEKEVIMKNVVILGGTGGIGKATADSYLKLGYRVVVSGTNQDKLNAITKNFKEYSNKDLLLTKQADLTDYNSVLSLKEFVREKLTTCDVLVNSAGVFKDGLLHESSEYDFDIQFNVNVKGVYHSCKAFIPLMLENEGGAIVNVASVSGIRGDYNASLYSASKAAVINMTRGMALDYAGKGLRINTVSPSATETAMFKEGSTEEIINKFTDSIPSKKLGKPAEVASVILFIASDAAKHVTGQNIPVDGGLSAWSGQPRQDKEI